MNDNIKIARAARKRAAQRRARFKLVSFGAGVLITLAVVFAVLLNGRGGSDPVVPAALMETMSPTAATETMIAPTETSSQLPIITPTPIPEQTPEPELVEANEKEPIQPSTTPEPDFTVTLNVEDKVAMNVGETGQLRAKLDPSDPSAELAWKSSNEKVVKVNQKGTVKAVGSGIAEVSLYINGSEEPAATVAIKAEKKSTSGSVWIPKTGKKYHSTSTCSGMKGPRKVTLSYAKSHGYGKCSKCW